MKKMYVMVAALALAGCATMQKQVFTPPVVSFKDLRLEGVGLTGGTLDVVLGIYNPNGFRLDASRLIYRLMVDTMPIGEGVYEQPFTVQSGDSATIRLPVSLDYKGLGEAGKQLMGRGAVNYRIVGEVTAATVLGQFHVPYSQSGRFTTFGGASH